MLLALLASAPPSPGTQELLFAVAFIACVVGAILSLIGWRATPAQPGVWWGGSWLWFLLFLALSCVVLVWLLLAASAT